MDPVRINLASGGAVAGQTIVAAGTPVRIIAAHIMVSAEVDISFVDHAGTVILGPYPCASKGDGIVLPENSQGHGISADGLIVKASGAVAFTGSVNVKVSG